LSTRSEKWLGKIFEKWFYRNTGMKTLLPVVIAFSSLSNFVSAQIWTQTSAPSNHWASIASSADGTIDSRING
jgi:hypothetical protein